MRILGAIAVVAMLATPAYAQISTPHINLLSDGPTKTPDEIEQDQVRDKAYRESLKKIPDAKTSSDPWGNVRSEAPKAATPAKPKTKTGSAQQ
ncbi:hypothetical protein [Bradyrhizobium sp. Leo121]|uniref:hypothetical protein n=1 Tax=Bradyrhizobium sp. Leo121 TaxID=1571195 RepID=UPI00102A6A03|nr:hypothetical protein [Bradyrhizobium sp. Leo121]RZN23999.1 hypothetical protein CWO90_29685 [Bradyrhizobium sp. Leo121]